MERLNSKKENESLGDFAYRYIKDKTMNFDYLPGEKLNEVELAKTLGISRAPIREALNRLEGDKLVVFESGKGFFCRKLNVKEILNLFEIRSDLELAGVKKVCQEASKEDIKELLLKWEEIERKSKDINTDNLVDLDESFHLELMDLANNDERIDILKNINDRIRFVRKVNLDTELRRFKFISDHLKIMEAIYNDEVDLAVELLKKHLDLNAKDFKMNIADVLKDVYGEDIVFE